MSQSYSNAQNGSGHSNHDSINEGRHHGTHKGGQPTTMQVEAGTNTYHSSGTGSDTSNGNSQNFHRHRADHHRETLSTSY